MNFRLLGILVLPLFISALLTGCGGPDPKEEAKESFDVVFDALKRSDVEGALMLYSPSFFKTTPRQNWLQTLRQIHNSFGPVVSYEILESQSRKDKEPIPGTYVGFQCKVNYQRGYLMENIVLVRPDGLQSFTISGHSIVQPGPRTPPQQQQPQQQSQQQPQQPQAPAAPAAPGAQPPSQPQMPPAPPQGTAPPAVPQSPTLPPGAAAPPAAPQPTQPPAAPPVPAPDAGTTPPAPPATPGKTE